MISFGKVLEVVSMTRERDMLIMLETRVVRPTVDGTGWYRYCAERQWDLCRNILPQWKHQRPLSEGKEHKCRWS